MIPGLYLKSPPPSPHSEGIVLVAAAISKAPDLSIRTPSPSPYSAGIVLMPAALSTTPGLFQNPHHLPIPHHSCIHSLFVADNF